MLDESAKRAALGMLPYGLHVLAARHEGQCNAMAINWVTQCSFKPPMLALAIESDAHTLELVRGSGRLALAILRADQRAVATGLSRPWSRVPDKLGQISTEETASGIRVPADALAWVECAVRTEVPTGDHVVVIGEVVEATLHEKAEPLTLRAAGLRYGW